MGTTKNEPLSPHKGSSSGFVLALGLDELVVEGGGRLIGLRNYSGAVQGLGFRLLR